MSEICSTCGLPEDLCVCESIAKEQQKIQVSSIKKKFGKIYTVIKGIDPKQIDIKDLTKKLKSIFACGGTYKDEKIELQGNHKQHVREALVKMDFAPETIEIK
ncbi:translation initiation factor [Candidatus Woesearchaeota archaeon]|jgi:translation initiation factor 1|nr:translation initiation factor [Candidatus Woesearchaeota archaeon]